VFRKQSDAVGTIYQRAPGNPASFTDPVSKRISELFGTTDCLGSFASEELNELLEQGMSGKEQPETIGRTQRTTRDIEVGVHPAAQADRIALLIDSKTWVVIPEVVVVKRALRVVVLPGQS